MAWLRLVRFPNVFTALADVAMGCLFVRGTLTPTLWFALVALSSACLYMGGMVLNDVFDIQQDRRERPDRPLPSGAIALRHAAVCGVALLAVGIAVAFAATWSYRGEGGGDWRTPGIAAGLSMAILAYDALWKRTWLGPVNMGLCRALNVLLGMSVPAAYTGSGWGFDPAQLVVVIGLGTYVAGITLFARNEALVTSRANLYLGILVMVLGLGILAAFPRFPPFVEGNRRLSFAWRGAWPLTVLVLGLSIIRPCVVAAVQGSPPRVQTAVKHCILSLIVLDAAVAMAVDRTMIGPLLVLSLLVPFLAFGRVVYST